MTNLQYFLYIITQIYSSNKPSFIEHLLILSQQNPDPLTNLVKILEQLKAKDRQIQKATVLNNRIEKLKLENALVQSKTLFSTILDEDYPNDLRQIPDPPLIVYYKGDLNILQSNHCVGFVGSRKASSYGKNSCDQIIRQLKDQTITIISGLAFGIDSQSHTSAIHYSLPTAAVLGSGLSEENIYPKANYNLSAEILHSGGLLITEYPPHCPALKHQFIARNRIIAALSKIVIVIEATKSSGALITADFAIDYNKQVFALPGSIYSAQSFGTHNLLKSGAGVITEGEDILNELNLTTKADPNPQQLTKTQANVLRCIQLEPLTFEQIQEQSKLQTADLISALAELELSKLVYEISPQVYSSKIA